MSDSNVMTPSKWRELLLEQFNQMETDGVVPIGASPPECSWEPVNKTVTVNLQVPPGCVVVYDQETGEPRFVNAKFGVLVRQTSG